MSEYSQRASLNLSLLHELRIKYNHTCLCCGRREGWGIPMVVGHVRPIVKGGGDEMANLQLLCWGCNNTHRTFILDFRNPDWQERTRSWSVAERQIREHLVNTGRYVARHPDFQLPPPTYLYLDLWDCLGYSAAQISRALWRAIGLGYRYPQTLPASNDYLHGKAVASVRYPSLISAELQALLALHPLPPRPPRRVVTRLKGMVHWRTRVGHRQGWLMMRRGPAPARWIQLGRSSTTAISAAAIDGKAEPLAWTPAIIRRGLQQRAVKKKLSRAKIGAALMRTLKLKYHKACLCCGKREAAGVSLVPDHVKPHIMGGSDAIENLQLLCSHCNNIKHDRELDFRDPHWSKYERWSVAELAMRQYMVWIGRDVAFHPDYQLGQQELLCIELWNGLGYAENPICNALVEAEALDYRYPATLGIANALLKGWMVEARRSARVSAPHAASADELPPVREQPKPGLPHRVTTRLAGRRPPRTRLYRRAVKHC